MKQSDRATATRNAARNGIANIQFREADVFQALTAHAQCGHRFDTVILDPPAFTSQVRSSHAAVNDAFGASFAGGASGPMNTALARQSRPLSTTKGAPAGPPSVNATFSRFPLALFTM